VVVVPAFAETPAMLAFIAEQQICRLTHWHAAKFGLKEFGEAQPVRAHDGTIDHPHRRVTTASQDR
jgi:hypothetical protein